MMERLHLPTLWLCVLPFLNQVNIDNSYKDMTEFRMMAQVIDDTVIAMAYPFL